jgi:hypothetical protein
VLNDGRCTSPVPIVETGGVADVAAVVEGTRRPRTSHYGHQRDQEVRTPRTHVLHVCLPHRLKIGDRLHHGSNLHHLTMILEFLVLKLLDLLALGLANLAEIDSWGEMLAKVA